MNLWESEEDDKRISNYDERLAMKSKELMRREAEMEVDQADAVFAWGSMPRIHM